MIYCGSGSSSYFGKVLVPVLVPIPAPDIFRTVFQQQNICTKSSLFNARSSIVSQKVGLYCNFLFFNFCSTFVILDWFDPEQECITVPVLVPLRQKVEVPAVPVPQHCFFKCIYFSKQTSRKHHLATGEASWSPKRTNSSFLFHVTSLVGRIMKRD
jgi:hypothetical protein